MWHLLSRKQLFHLDSTKVTLLKDSLVKKGWMYPKQLTLTLPESQSVMPVDHTSLTEESDRPRKSKVQ